MHISIEIPALKQKKTTMYVESPLEEALQRSLVPYCGGLSHPGGCDLNKEVLLDNLGNYCPFSGDSFLYRHFSLKDHSYASYDRVLKPELYPGWREKHEEDEKWRKKWEALFQQVNNPRYFEENISLSGPKCHLSIHAESGKIESAKFYWKKRGPDFEKVILALFGGDIMQKIAKKVAIDTLNQNVKFRDLAETEMSNEQLLQNALRYVIRKPE